MAKNLNQDSFGVYVHWPFCAAKCPYCDFNSHVRAEKIDQQRYVAAFAREIAHRAAIMPGAEVTSIFFGGGTPSLMEPATVGAILDSIGKAWTIASDVEISLEANPTSVEAGRFAGYRSAGINRVSLGVQALDDGHLKKLGRMHTVSEAMRALLIARGTFERVSFDLIYARPDQTPRQWAAELKQAIERGVDHLSLYQLTIEPDTMFERLVATGKLKPMPAEDARVLWDVTQETCDSFGMPAYEVSNHARPGAECQHNLVYWRYGAYAGVGPGAHGRLVDGNGVRHAHATEKMPEAWLMRVEREGHGLVEDETLDREAQGDELLLMGLRLREGIDLSRFSQVRGRAIAAARLRSLIEEGMIEQLSDERVRVTAEGFPVLDAVVADLAA